MPSLAFSKWSPGGNITIFLPLDERLRHARASLAQHALAGDMLGGEQAGFVDVAGHRLHMAGGEFCCNATRAFGALLALEGEAPDGRAHVQSSGWPSPVELDIMGAVPSYTVAATLDLPSSVVAREVDRGMALVRLPGIDHILLDATCHREPVATSPAEASALVGRLAAGLGLGTAPCVGAIWWRNVGRGPISGKDAHLAMRPLVHVRAVNTTFFESSCGSGALALALWLAGQGVGSFCIDQPSGQPLFVDIVHSGTRARVSGPVTLLARGQAWLDA